MSMRPRSYETGFDLGVDAELQSLGKAIARYVMSQAQVAMENAPQWQVSLEHLRDWATFQLSGMGDRLSSLERKVGDLQRLAASQIAGRPVDVSEPEEDGTD